MPISIQDGVCCGYFGNLRVCPVYKSDEQSERGRVLLSYKINVFTMFFLRECVCIIAAALAALPLSPPEILIHPQKNLLFKTIGLQTLIEWIVMPVQALKIRSWKAFEAGRPKIGKAATSMSGYFLAPASCGRHHCSWVQ